MATEVGNIHIGLYVDVGESRRFTDVANIVEKSSRRMNSALGNTSTAVRALRGQMSQSLQFRVAQNSLRDLARATDATTQLRAAIVGLSSVATGSLTGAFSAAYLIQTADKARLLSNQIKTVTNSTAEFGAIQESLFDVSQRTRSSYESTTTLYSRMARATDHFSMSQDKLLRVTETVQKAFSIGGASPQEAQGGAIQLSQGIASNRLGGEEFRSVAENAPVLLKGIADALNVNIGKLREMAHAGELTSQVVTEAILKSASTIDAAFAKMTPTVAQSWTLLNNAIIRYAGASDEAYGVTEKIGAAIAGLAANLEDVMYWVTRVVGGLGAVYAARKLVLGAQGQVEGVRNTNAGIRDQMDGLVDENGAISKRLVQIDKERLTVTSQIASANAKVVSSLQRQVEEGKKIVRDNALRVIQTTPGTKSEVASIERYQRSLDNLQRKMEQLAATPAVSSDSVQIREKLAQLDAESANLLERQVLNSSKLEAAEKRLSVLRRAGAGFLGAFGGPWGLGITVALVGASALMAKFAANAAQSAEQTEKITQQLESMGYLTGAAADEMGRFQDNVANGRMSKLQLELDAFNKDVKGTIKTLKDMDIGESISDSFGSFEVDTGDVNAMRKAFEGFYKSRESAVDTLTDDLTSIRDEMVKNKGMSEDMRKALEDMALANPDLASVVQTLVQMGSRLNALREATKDWTDSIKRAREETQKNPQERFGEYLEEEARLRAKYDQGVARVAGPEISESAFNDYETQIKKTMDSLIKKAKELGETMLESDARRTAEVIYANDVSKKGLRDLIGLYEGTDKGRGYNETLDYGKYTGGDVNLTAMTLKEVLELQRKMLAHPDNDKNSSAVGRYQIVSQTLKGLIDQLGLSLETVFTPELQDRLADQLIRGRGRDAAGLRNEWEGLRNAPDQQILRAFDQSSTSLPRVDQSAQQWLDGMKDLNLKSQIAALKEFDQQVLQTAQSMGLSNEELQKYIEAAKSGNLDAVPPKFREIVAAMREAESIDLSRQWRDLQASNLVPFLGDLDQKVVETAKSLGIAEDRIRDFVQAALSGGQVTPTFAAIRDEVDKMAGNQSLIDFADGAAEAFGGLISDLAHGENAFKNLALRLADVALEILVIQPLVDSLKTSFRGLAAGSSGSGGGGLLTGFFKLLGFDQGGWTGPGAKDEPKGVVHGDEYVFSKKAVNKIGVGPLEALHEFLITGKSPGSMSLPGYMEGGHVSSKPTLPAVPGSFATPDSSVGGLAETLRTTDSSVHVTSDVVVRMQEDGTLQAFVEKTAAKAADRRVRHYDTNLPGRLEAINRHPRRRTTPVK